MLHRKNVCICQANSYGEVEMKTRIVLLIIILLLLFTPMLTMAQPPEYNGNDLVWVLEPVYDEVRYRAGAFYYSGLIFDTYTGEFFPDNGTWDRPFGGSGFHEWLYDEDKELYGHYGRDYDDDYKMYSLNDFMEYWERFPNEDLGNRLNVFRKIDSEKVKIEVDESGWTTCDLSEAYTGKYALAYGTTFITDFIYDYSPYWYNKNDRKNAVAVQFHNKWGIIDKNGNVLTPFIFDELTFIDDDTAFAKYENKYGILNVAQTAMALKERTISPQTGDQNLIPLWVIICFCAIKLFISVVNNKKIC